MTDGCVCVSGRRAGGGPDVPVRQSKTPDTQCRCQRGWPDTVWPCFPPAFPSSSLSLFLARVGGSSLPQAPPSLLGLGTADPFSAGKAADARWADGDAGRRLDGGGLDLDGLAADLASIPLCDRLDVDGTRAIHGALHPNSVLRYAAEADAAARDISPVDSSEINTREPPQGGLGGTPGGIGSNTVVDSIMTTAGTRPPGLPAPAPAPGIETSESGTAGSGDDDDDGNLEDWLDSVLA